MVFEFKFGDIIDGTYAPTTEPTTNPTTSPVFTFGPITFDSTSMYNFTHKSMHIGWLQFATCTEGNNPLTYHSDYGLQGLLDIVRYAVTIQIGPSTNIPGVSETDDYTFTADLCSNPMYAVNRGYEPSFTVNTSTSPPEAIGYADVSNWITAGTQSHHLTNSYLATNAPLPLNTSIYWGAGNSAGILIVFRLCSLFLFL